MVLGPANGSIAEHNQMDLKKLLNTDLLHHSEERKHLRIIRPTLPHSRLRIRSVLADCLLPIHRFFAQAWSIP